jgi:hypothetical protein
LESDYGGNFSINQPFSTPVISYALDTGIAVAERGRNDVNRRFRKCMAQDLVSFGGMIYGVKLGSAYTLPLKVYFGLENI